MTKLKRFQYPLILFFSSRLAIFLLASVFIGLWPVKSHPTFLQAFSQWDGRWYLEIVKNGYWYKGLNIQSPVAFFPLYPLLGKSFTLLGFSPELALFLVSNLSCLGFFIVFWQLMKLEFGKKVADRALFYYAISPLSFILSSLYAESLFLFLICLFFYWLKKENLLKASLTVCLAGATRNLGVLLLAPLLIKAWQKKKDFKTFLSYGVISSAGLFFYSLYCYLKFGKWLVFLEIVRTAWHRRLLFPWQTLKILIEAFFTIRATNLFFSVLVFDFSVIVLCGFLIIWSFKKRLLDKFYFLFVIPYYLLVLSQVWEPSFFLPSGSMARYLFVLFPLMAVLGKLGTEKRYLEYLIIFLSIALFAPFALAFFHQQWIQ